MVTTFDVAAQFGGPDAAQVMVPHWRALKLAAADWERVRLNLQKFMAAYKVHVKKDVLRSESTG